MSCNGLKITDIIIFPVKNQDAKSNLLAFAKCVLNEHFLVCGIQVRRGAKENFISFPKEAPVEGRAWDICYPITAEFRSYMSEMILGRFDEIAGRMA